MIDFGLILSSDVLYTLLYRSLDAESRSHLMLSVGCTTGHGFFFFKSDQKSDLLVVASENAWLEAPENR